MYPGMCVSRLKGNEIRITAEKKPEVPSGKFIRIGII